jgi:hypothetical protein
MINTERTPQVVDRAGGRECLDFVFIPEPDSAIADLLGDLRGSANVDAMTETGGHTGRLETRFEPLYTESALLCYAFVVIELYHPKRAGFNTHHTATARLGVNQNHAIIALGDSVFWTGLCAARSAAMHTVLDQVAHLRVALRIPTGVLVDAYPIRTGGQIVLLLAGNFAGVAPHTRQGVY